MLQTQALTNDSGSPSARGTKDKRIPSLDGLRAFSILFVLIGHASTTMPASFRATMAPAIRWLPSAEFGVFTFFVISGYLITWLLRKEMDATASINLRDFYLRRILRIFPAFYSYLLVIVLLVISGKILLPARLLLSAATYSLNYRIPFLNSHADIPHYWFIGHFWTLSLEEQFYLIWPFTLLLLKRQRARQVCLAIILLSPFIRIATYFLIPQVREQIGMMLPTAGDFILLGSFIALSEGGPAFEAFVARLSNGVPAIIAAIVALVIVPLIDSRIRGFGVSIGASVQTLCIAVIMLSVTRYPGSFFGRILNCRQLVYTGVLSYSIYLWQQLFLTPFNTTFFGKFPLNLICCIVAGLASHQLIEKPFLRLKSHLSHTGKAHSAVETR